MQNLVGGPKGVSSGRRGEFDTFCAFLFLLLLLLFIIHETDAQ